MVRIGTLPMRLLTLEYGADLVWSPETVDVSLIGATRVEGEDGVVLFVKNSRVMFSCHTSEKSKLILQLGSSDAETAVQAVKVVENDISGIDLNCGCPKRFSMIGGMGASLLRPENQHKLLSILQSLREAYPHIPVSCKIRLLDSTENTIELLNKIIGLPVQIAAITIHCRTVAMRSRSKALWEEFTKIVEHFKANKHENMPSIIINGDVRSFQDIDQIRTSTGVGGLMVGRGIYNNMNIFTYYNKHIDEKPDRFEVAKKYLEYAVRVDNIFQNTKYTVLQVCISGSNDRERRIIAKLTKAKTNADLQDAFD